MCFILFRFFNCFFNGFNGRLIWKGYRLVYMFSKKQLRGGKQQNKSQQHIFSLYPLNLMQVCYLPKVMQKETFITNFKHSKSY